MSDHAHMMLRIPSKYAVSEVVVTSSITLDGIAKGYVVSQGIAALREAGIEYSLMDAGGEIRSTVARL